MDNIQGKRVGNAVVYSRICCIIALPKFCPLFLLFKPIIDHAHCRHRQQSNASNINGVAEFSLDSNIGRDSSSAASSLEQVPSCWICLEAFQVGEMVSWSSTSDCDHVFHPSCIETWLLRHDDCPCCRRLYLLVDYTRLAIPKSILKALAKARNKRRQTTFYCIQDGLVTIESLAEKESQQSDVEAGGLPAAADADIRVETYPEDQFETSTASMDSDDDSNTHQNEVVLPFPGVVSSRSDSALGSHHLRLSSCDGENEWSDDDCINHRVILKKESSETNSTVASSVVSQV